MGYIHLPVTVRNPADASKELEVNFLVDTGAYESLIPKAMLETIDIAPEGKRNYVMADGREVRLDVAVARMEIMGELVLAKGGTRSTVIFGDEGTEPLLGALDLQAAGVCGRSAQGDSP